MSYPKGKRDRLHPLLALRFSMAGGECRGWVPRAAPPPCPAPFDAARDRQAAGRLSTWRRPATGLRFPLTGLEQPELTGLLHTEGQFVRLGCAWLGCLRNIMSGCRGRGHGHGPLPFPLGSAKPRAPSAHDMGERAPFIMKAHRQAIAHENDCGDMQKRELDIGHVNGATVDIHGGDMQQLLIVETGRSDRA